MIKFNKIIFLFFTQVIFSQNYTDSLSYYFKIGNYQKAIIYGEKQKQLNTKKDTDYAILANNLATSYSRINDYKNAELNYLEELEIEKSFFGENHRIISTTYRNLGNVCSANKDYKKAESYFFKSIEVFQKGNNTNLLEYTDCLLDLAVTLKDVKDYKNAEIIFNSAEQLLKLNQGEESNYYFKGLLSIAIFYYDIHNINKSDEIISKITNYYKLKIIDEKEFKNIKNDAFFFLNIAEFFKRKNDLKNAEIYYNISIELANKYIGQNEIIYSDILYSSSLFYYEVNNNEKTGELFKKFSKNYNLQIFQKTNYYTVSELNLFKNDFFYRIFSVMSFLQSHPTQYTGINIGCYENELLLKNLSLRNQQRVKTTIEKKGNVVVKEKYQQFIDNKRYLTKLDELPIAQKPKEYDQLKTDTENLEKELTRISSTFTDSKKSLSITWKQIQEKLQPNEVAIDLVLYNFYNKKWTDSIMYGAFVVKKDSKFPKYIPLFEQKQLKFLMERNSKDENTIQVRKLNKQYSDKAISELFLKPLEKELQGISTIYLSPSGLGHQIDFSALPVSETQTLGDKYAVHILGSTSEIVNYKVTHLDQKTKLELLLYGDIDYNKSETTSIATNDTIENNCDTEFAGLATRSGITKWNYLIGTKKEVEQIKIVGQQNGFSTKIMNERNATEESIKHLDGRITPYVLHLATHGFFFPDPKQELPKEDLLSDSKSKIYKTADDPMMRSGLLFAGANRYWGKPTENITTDDGILTANEISNLDLSSCQLVVMSSCETGLGDINGSEGVFGLQRAFKMAGVKNIIMSLWKVPDIETAELFDVFYTECLAGKTIHEAFQTAQAKMKLKYSPYYWAGFVLLE